MALQSDSLPADSGLHCWETGCQAYDPNQREDNAHSGFFHLAKELVEAAGSCLCECKFAPAQAGSEEFENPTKSRSEQRHWGSCWIKI